MDDELIKICNHDPYIYIMDKILHKLYIIKHINYKLYSIKHINYNYT